MAVHVANQHALNETLSNFERQRQMEKDREAGLRQERAAQTAGPGRRRI